MGPLDGIKILEIAGIGPGPFCAMLLADLGAEVLRIERVANVGGATRRRSTRSRAGGAASRSI